MEALNAWRTDGFTDCCSAEKSVLVQVFERERMVSPTDWKVEFYVCGAPLYPLSIRHQTLQIWSKSMLLVCFWCCLRVVKQCESDIISALCDSVSCGASLVEGTTHTHTYTHIVTHTRRGRETDWERKGNTCLFLSPNTQALCFLFHDMNNGTTASLQHPCTHWFNGFYSGIHVAYFPFLGTMTSATEKFCWTSRPICICKLFPGFY